MLALELVLRKDEGKRGAAIYGKLECLRFSIYSQSYKTLSVRMQISPILTPPSCLASSGPSRHFQKPNFCIYFQYCYGYNGPLERLTKVAGTSLP